jgi:hypothetical protein
VERFPILYNPKKKKQNKTKRPQGEFFFFFLPEKIKIIKNQKNKKI